MSNKLSISFFATSSKEGEALKFAFSQMAENEGFEIEFFQIDYPSTQFLIACRCKDIVVFDATIEEGGNDNYAIPLLTVDAMVMDHVLFVSRKYLPINVTSLREQHQLSKFLGQSIPEYPQTLTNALILKWLTTQIKEIKHHLDELKRPRNLLDLRHIRNFHDIQKQRFNEKGKIFMSFRKANAPDVKQLAERIQTGEFHNGQEHSVLYFPPGSLSFEFMTEQRRWQVISIISDRISAADEVWIYESQDYYNSWWTLAELFIISHLHNRSCKVRIYSHETQNLQDASNDFLPNLSKKQSREATWLFTKGDRITMGPGHLDSIRALGRFLSSIGLKKTWWNDRVYSDEFWNNPVLDCPYCRKIGRDRNRFNIDILLYCKGPNFTRFTPDQISRYLQKGTVACANPNCKTVYQFKEGAPHYLWLSQYNAYEIVNSLQNRWMALSKGLVAMPTYIIN